MSAVRALLNNDVSWLICEELAMKHCHTPSERLQCRQDLARLARVCKEFQLPATRVLWRVMPDIMPLLNLISCIQELACNAHASAVSDQVYGSCA